MADVEKVWNFPYAPVAANRLLRMHWARRRQERKTWSTLLTIAGPAPRKAPWKARVAVTVRRARLQDPDNAVASLKPVLDALVARGWLWDDSGEHLELEVREEVSRVEQTTIRWTVIQVEDQ